MNSPAGSESRTAVVSVVVRVVAGTPSGVSTWTWYSTASGTRFHTSRTGWASCSPERGDSSRSVGPSRSTSSPGRITCLPMSAAPITSTAAAAMAIKRNAGYCPGSASFTERNISNSGRQCRQAMT
jgi:hypothetical protein